MPMAKLRMLQALMFYLTALQNGSLKQKHDYLERMISSPEFPSLSTSLQNVILDHSQRVNDEIEKTYSYLSHLSRDNDEKPLKYGRARGKGHRSSFPRKSRNRFAVFDPINYKSGFLRFNKRS